MRRTPWWKRFVKRNPKYGGVLANAYHVKRLERCKYGHWVRVHHQNVGSWEYTSLLVDVNGEDWEDWDIFGGPAIYVTVKDDNGVVHRVEGRDVEIVGRRNTPRKVKAMRVDFP
jgi:hypothetical protein